MDATTKTSKLLKETSVKFPSGKILNFPKNTTAKTLASDEEFKNLKIVAFLINKKLVSLHHPLFISKAEIQPISLESDDQATFIYIASYMFLLGMAIDGEIDQKLQRLTAEHQLGQGSFLEISNLDSKISKEFTEKIKKKMDDLIDQNLIIEEDKLTFEDSLEYFEKQKNQIYTSELIKSKNDSEVKVNSCNGYFQLFSTTPLCYSTGMLMKDFQITPHNHGILFEYPKILDIHNIDYFNESLIPLYRESSKFQIYVLNLFYKT